MLVSILVALLIFILVIWVIGLIPFPGGLAPVKVLLYIIAAVLLLSYLFQYVRS